MHLSLREWEYLKIGEAGGAETVARDVANGLIAAAVASPLGGEEGQNILINGHKRLRAQQVVGMLVSRQATLEILPKIDTLETSATRTNLVHMLARVFDLNVETGGGIAVDTQKKDLLEVFIGAFCQGLFEAIRKGLARSYIRRENDLPAMRGRIDIKRQFTVLAVSPQKLACRYEELDPDIPLNQVMKATVGRLSRLSRSLENQRRLSELSFALAEVTAIPVQSLPWNNVVLDRTNVAWSSLLRLARLFLNSDFQTISAGSHSGFSLLFEMNVLFEEYIGRTMRAALSHEEFTVQLQGPREFVLRDQNGHRRFATRPDIVVRREGKIALIVDTKWKRLKGALEDPKRGVGQADIYQMIAYAHVYRCDRLLLLYPHEEGADDEEGVISTLSVQGTEKTKIYIASISLVDLQTVECRLLALVQQIFGAPVTGAVPAALAAQLD